MEIRQFMEQIHLPEEGQRYVSSIVMPEKSYIELRRLFYENEEEFFQIINQRIDKEGILLYLYVRFAADLYPQYREMEISDKIYYDTFSDFTIWFGHCIRRKHTIGLIEENWLKLHLKMKLFRLGRLQFEKDEKLKRIHIHIPEGEPLSPEACDASLLLAKNFFNASCQSFDCESWLLAPALSELLDEDNRIIQFQKRFRVEWVNNDSRQAEERVFGNIQENKNSYPENTSLQRALKKYLLTGKNPGVGYGILKSHILPIDNN